MQTLVAIDLRLRATLHQPYVCACARLVLRMRIDTSDYVNVCWQISFGDEDNRRNCQKRISYFISRRFHPLQFLLPSLPPILSGSLVFTFSSARFLLLIRLSSICNCVIYRLYVGSRSNMHAHVQHGDTIRQHWQQHRQPLSLLPVCISVDQPEHKFAVDLSYFCLGSLNCWPITVEEICFLNTRRDILRVVTG